MVETRTHPTGQTELPETFVGFCEGLLGVRLTLGQRVLSRVTFDDVDPCELETEAEREMALELFGDVDRVPDHARTVAYWLKGGRMGGTYLWALFLTYSAFACPMADMAPGEIAFGAIVAPKLRLARQALRYCVGAIQSVPKLRRAIVGTPNKDSFSLIRDDGHRVTIECMAASRGGAATRGFSYFGGLLDESSFFYDADSGVVNDSEVYRSIAARVLPGGKLGVISTAWAERGLLWDKIQENYDHPKTGIAAIAKTLTVRDTKRNRAVVEEERQRDPLNAAREFDCIPFDTGTAGFFDIESIDAAMTPMAAVTYGDGCPVALGIDTAFRRDATGGVITRRENGRFIVGELVEVKPEPGKPLKPSEVLSNLVNRGKAHRAQTLIADQHYIETVREHAGGIKLIEAPAGNAGKMMVFLAARTALLERRVTIPDCYTELAEQLKNVVAKPLPGGGLVISSPRSRSGHGDAASAFVLTLWHLASGGSWSDIATEGFGGITASKWDSDSEDDWDDD